jgi:hypothetical protein
MANRSERFRLIADSWFQADVAQLVEHSLGKGEVTSSILVIGSRIRKQCLRVTQVWGVKFG